MSAVGRIKILMVDDEPDLALLVRQRFRRQIRSGDIEFVFAGHGLDALEAFDREGDIDVVLTDINMPVMDGLALLEHLKGRSRIHKAIVVSAYDDLVNIRTAMNRGAFDFITKPIDFQDLEITLARAIEQLQAARRAADASIQLGALRRELEIAGAIQRSILPAPLPCIAGHGMPDLEGRMIPALEIGGDFYDYFPLDDDRVAFMIGDVAGKGISAALVMAVSRTLLRATGQMAVAPSVCMAAANRGLAAANTARLFVTAWYGVMDRRTGHVDFCNAGHEPAILLRGGRATVLPAEPNLVLGVESAFPYTGDSVSLDPGDTLIFHTDGVTEAENPAGEQYGIGRLLEAVETSAFDGPSRLLDAVIEDVRAFVGRWPAADDITLLALRWTCRPDEPEAGSGGSGG